MMRLRNAFTARRPAAPSVREPASPQPAAVLVARRPVFTSALRVDAYELAFRPSTAGGPCGDRDPRLASGWDRLTGGRRALVSLTPELLASDRVPLLPAATILWIRAGTVDAPLLDTCARLRRAGYDLMVDGPLLGTGDGGLASVASIIRLDLAAPRDGGRTAAPRPRGGGIPVLATSVETRDEFAQAEALGCTHFEGSFFRKPADAGGAGAGSTGTRAQLLAGAARADLARLEGLIGRDRSLSSTFLSFVDVVSPGWPSPIPSLRQALVILDPGQLRRCVCLAAVAGTGGDKPAELAVDAVVRARLGESLTDAPALAGRGHDLFLLGLFSTVDGVLDLPMGEAVARIPVSEDVRAALLGTAGPLRDGLDLVNAYTRGNWPVVAEAASRIGLAEDDLPGRYAAAVTWADGAFRAARGAGEEIAAGR